MTLTQMNYIITISETGSLNKAAEALYISQPSLTNAVKELEKELGIIIFNRSGRGVTLTNDGTEFPLTDKNCSYLPVQRTDRDILPTGCS